MNIYLVDFENVNSQGLSGINCLDSSDQVVIFYSENADSMTFDLHTQINESRAYIYFQKVDVGTKNALDFQLATYLGYLICENEKKEKPVSYYIVTKDHGFASLVGYWTKRGMDISLVGSLGKSRAAEAEKDDAQPQETKELKKNKRGRKSKSAKKDKNEKAEQKESDIEASQTQSEKKEKPGRKKKAVSDEEQQLRIQVEQAVSDKSVVDLVVSYIQKYKTKLGINNALAKEFKDSKKASEIYKSIKPLIADKKGQ